jgi:hypothetical protein
VAFKINGHRKAASLGKGQGYLAVGFLQKAESLFQWVSKFRAT